MLCVKSANSNPQLQNVRIATCYSVTPVALKYTVLGPSKSTVCAQRPVRNAIYIWRHIRVQNARWAIARTAAFLGSPKRPQNH